MIALEVIDAHGDVTEYRFDAPRPLTIGREMGADVVLRSDLVSRRHAHVQALHDGFEVDDRSANGTLVDGELTLRSRRRTRARCELQIGPYILRLQLRRGSPRASEVGHPVLHPPPAMPPSSRSTSGLKPLPTPAKTDRRGIRQQLLEHLDLANLDLQRTNPDALRPRVRAALERICGADPDAERLIAELIDEVLGLGPLQPLLADPDISEIMVVDPKTIYVERRGRIERTPHHFTDDDSVRSVLERIVAPLGRRIDESVPTVDARLPDGSRVHAIIPPLALRGPCITIRKFGKGQLGFADLVRGGSMSETMAAFLGACVVARKNIVIAGGTGSGKTTLLNVLSSSIPGHERIVTIEDAAELQLAQEHVVGLETRPPNLEGRGEYTIRDLVRNALRMRPDRIVVGECRGAEALDMLQAMNTGHDGSMTTTHASSPREAITRLEMLCLLSGVDLPVSALRQQIGSSIDLLLQQQRLADGSRRVTSITEVTGIDDDGHVELAEIYRFQPARAENESGRFAPTGHLPTFMHELVIAADLIGAGTNPDGAVDANANPDGAVDASASRSEGTA